jgi:4-diphosphocytidyl-2-C-methyl-D-erythritol kinase
MTAPLLERAPAKVNLTLRVLARRGDGLHEIESLVAFARIADELTLDMSRPLGLDLRGENRDACGPAADNLILKCAQALAAVIPGLRLGHFTLDKHLPVAAGLGGGSADAAAALRLLAGCNSLALDDPRLQQAAGATGADVPVCLDPQPRLMRGTGEILSEPIALPPLSGVLVNPGVALATKDVFATFDRLQNNRPAKPESEGGVPREPEALLGYLAERRNDLEAAAISLASEVAQVLAALQALPKCRLARMSGSGATCYALFDSMATATAAEQALRADHPGWWTRATALGPG